MTSLLSVKEPFEIFVGDGLVHTLKTGVLDKGKSSLRSGYAFGEIEYSGGDEIFPNYWEAWGRRVLDGKPKKEGVYEVVDTLYRGEIEFLEYGNPDGYMIECRWVAGQSSLDYQYQITRLNIVTKEKDEKNLLLVLERGAHKIDPVRDASYALAIKVHPMNKNSTFKTQRYTNYLYKEKNVFDTTKKEVKEINIAFEAHSIVENCSTSFAKLKVLHNVLCADGKSIRYDESDETSLYNTLVLYANEEPAEVLRLVQKYKEETSSLIERGKAYSAFDTTKNGIIMAGGTKKENLFPDVEVKGKGDDMLQWVFENAFEPNVNKGINKLHELSVKIFK